ncbi:MBL fold metallo-hydrolase [Actinomadura harenae]|uniref:MBL fold metallo-hydrolase n=1 Tax=Actinomadura harenae TaxID=2483351 RepID=A0A3M2MCG5_9ACTN|nr:MBL fold metallo-hydrolase [Actinomadura harenae]RMI47191.1 MBL fold metallo-hydrolase [Actinomadura harenae]
MSAVPEPYLQEIADGIHAYVQPDGTWCLNNAGVLVGPDAVTLVDTTATERRTRRLREAVASVTHLPIRTVVNTHHHGDHTHGNHLFADRARVIGHDRCPAAVLEQGTLVKSLWPDVEWGDVQVSPPNVTFSDRMTLHLGDLRVELHYAGPAHTDNDVVVWIPERRTLLAGDIVFNGGTPFVLWGSVSGTLAALDRLRALRPTTVLPGHGPVGGPELFDRTARYLRWIQTLARDAAGAGLTPLQAAREAGLGEFADWTDSERVVGNLHRAFAEHAGAGPGAPIDTRTALIEMVEYNGGKPLTCLA